MGWSLRGYPRLAKLPLNFISTQTFDNISVLADTAGLAFDVSKGFGHNSNTSQTWLLHCGGFQNQKLTATIRYTSATTAGSQDMGTVIGALCMQGSTQNYLWARWRNDVPSIVSVVNGTSFTTLASNTGFSLAQDTDMTITFSRIASPGGGAALSATFVSGVNTSTVTATLLSSSNLLTGGLMGGKTNAKSMYCSAATPEQLAA